MAVEAPSGIVKWYSHNLVGPQTLATLKSMLTGKKQPGGSVKTSYVKLSDKEADELIENVKKEQKGFPVFDEANAPDKAEEYQKWLVARYHTKPKEEAFKKAQKESSTPKPTPALVPVKSNDEELVEEEIDSRILEILGLTEVTDFTYGEYKTLLRERAAAAWVGSSNIPRESEVLIANEFKRVKNKEEGKFKIKSKAINIDKVIDKVEGPGKTTTKLDPSKLLPPSKNIQNENFESKSNCCDDILKFLKNDLLDLLKSINSVITDILDVLKEQRALDKKKFEQSRIASEIGKKRSKEDQLEFKGESISNVISNIVKPFSGFFDIIRNFFMNILMGGAIKFLLSVIKDPSIILTPIKNFTNMVIKFLNDIISFLWNLVVSPINFVINSINTGIKSLIDQINNAIRLIPGSKPISSPQIPTIPGPPQIPTIPVQQQEGGGQTINIGDISLMSGGGVDKKTGVQISGFGKDTQLTALSPGEVVISNPAADFWGRDNLLAMNAIGGGSNKPKFGRLGIQAMQGGGIAGGKRIIFGAGHAPAIPGSTVGSDNRSVGGTEDPRTKVSESQAMMQLINAMKRIVTSNPDLYKDIGFHNITSYDGIKKDTKRLESSGSQFIELHLDQHGGGGRSGVISRNRTEIDNRLGKIFGFFPKNFKQGDLGVPDVGGTIVELAAVDDPRIRPFMDEVKKGKVGPATLKMASTILAATIGTTASKTPPPPPPQTRPNVIVAPAPKPTPTQPQGSTSGSASQNKVPNFSSDDPLNMSTMVIKSIYNMIG